MYAINAINHALQIVDFSTISSIIETTNYGCDIPRFLHGGFSYYQRGNTIQHDQMILGTLTYLSKLSSKDTEQIKNIESLVILTEGIAKRKFNPSEDMTAHIEIGKESLALAKQLSFALSEECKKSETYQEVCRNIQTTNELLQSNAPKVSNNKETENKLAEEKVEKKLVTDAGTSNIASVMREKLRETTANKKEVQEKNTSTLKRKFQ